MAKERLSFEQVFSKGVAESNNRNLRDQFAMAALTGLITLDMEVVSDAIHDVTTAAYLYADAMMEARK